MAAGATATARICHNPVSARSSHTWLHSLRRSSRTATWATTTCLNNYNPGYFGDGSDAYNDTNPHNTPFTIPGTTQRSIGDVLLENNISWKSYNDQWDRYLTDKYQLNYGKVGPQSDQYCNICNPFQYQKQIMTNAAVRTAHITDTDRSLQGYPERQTACRVVRETEWMGGWPPSLFEMGPI